MKKRFIYISFLITLNIAVSQTYWQQKVDYKIDVEMDVESYQYEGVQSLIYNNQSPDTLKSVYFHLFYNAFQPNSEMSIRLKNGKDRNTRFRVNFDTLQPQNRGYLKVTNIKQEGVSLVPKTAGTILEVPLSKPLLPKQSTEFTLAFLGQVPSMIRRAGKNSKDGIALSMAQWFPKMAEYDYDGWNAEPYLGREFHGVWGNFDVTIKIDKNYTVAASGYLQNKEEVGHGFAVIKKAKAKRGKLTWHFMAPNVHDFTWAADPEYVHDIYPGPNGVDLHFFYKNNPEIIENWKKLQPITASLMQFYNNTIGPYPYEQYSVVQGGDGGMEYAMLTLITGGRSYEGLVGVTAHELAHSWFQHVLATNEMKHEWMDEGFTSFISAYAEAAVLEKQDDFPIESSYTSYFALARSGNEQPQMTNANRYSYNYAYERTAYSKGAVFLAQLGYVIGQESLSKTLREYYKEFKFKHPRPNDFRRVAERISGIQLKWYLTDWTQTTNTIDYSIQSVVDINKDQTEITLSRLQEMPMPVDLLVNLKNGQQILYYIPLTIMRGEKENPYNMPWTQLEDWSWANPDYRFFIDHPKENILSIVIDPTFFLADINRDNNLYLYEENKTSSETEK